MTQQTTEQERRPLFRGPLRGDLLVILSMGALKLLIHLASNQNYGFHRDEFLYLAMGDHLAWGFFEVPPAIAAWSVLIRTILGDNLWAIRLLPALFGTGIAVLTGLLVREMGGRRFAQGLSMLLIIIAPVFLRSATLFQPVVFDQFYWLLGCYLLARWIDCPEKTHLWLIIGAVGGLGILNKYTMLFWGSGVLCGLLLTTHRRALLTPWPWLGGLLALLIASPNIAWQMNHDWPVLAHTRELMATQLVHGSPGGFLLQQILMPLPASLLFWLGGLWFFFFREGGKPFRLFGWLYLVILGMMLYLGAKAYYLAPMFPVLFAGGAILTERLIRQFLLFWLKPLLVAGLLIPGVIFAPYGLPVLPLNLLTDYCQLMARYAGLDGPLRTNDGQLGLIPMDYADMLGWETKADSVGAVLEELDPGDRAHTVIFTENYGQAGSLTLFGGKDFPPVYTFSSSYRYWSPPEDSARVFITVGLSLEILRPYFGKIRLKAFLENPILVPEEQQIAIYLCTKPVLTPKEFWEGGRSR